MAATIRRALAGPLALALAVLLTALNISAASASAVRLGDRATVAVCISEADMATTAFGADVAERGPPIAHGHTTPSVAVDPWSRSAGARLDAPKASSEIAYDSGTPVVPTDNNATATRTDARGTQGDLRLISGAMVAANAGRGALNLPFKSPALRSQVDDVVRHFDEFGAPPPGVAQGGLKGYPKGTYGNKNGALPKQPVGYYTESDIWTSGNGVKRGAERLIFGGNSEVYSFNHYAPGSFVRIR
jgi:hypothetical protein